jgi:subtilisin-like proprotein convertase family protein
VIILHDVPAELIVELESPQGTTVRLHDQSAGGGSYIITRYDLESSPDGPGSMDDFLGESTQGSWTLSVEDVGTASTGSNTLNFWKLHVSTSDGFGCEPKSCGEPTPTEAPDLDLQMAANGEQTDLVFDWSAITAAGYHLLQSTSPAFDSGVELIERTTSETTYTMADGVNITPELSFFQVRGVNSCNQEGP